MPSVFELPLWPECPFRDEIPSPLEIRRGVVYGIDQFVIDDPVTGSHVAAAVPKDDQDDQVLRRRIVNAVRAMASHVDLDSRPMKPAMQVVIKGGMTYKVLK